MFPILYDAITPGTVPQNNGLGVLSDCISCESEQARNGIYELVFQYPMNGIHAKDIAYRRVVKVKSNPTDDPQLYRIKRIGKEMNGVFAVYCKHISYDLSGNEITSGTASSASGACLLLQNAAPGYTIQTDKIVAADFEVDVPASVRSFFAGKKGSFLDVFGTAEIKYDNFDIRFLTHAGEDRGVEIRYGKNLLELSQEIDCDNLYTHVLCFYKVEGTKVVGDKVATGLTLDVPRTLVIDCSGDYDEVPLAADLTARATQFINNNNLTTPTNNIKLDFVQSGELTNRVDLCDTVSIYYEALGITRANVKCIRTKFDCLREKYIETEFGDVKADLTDSFVVASKAIEEKPSLSIMGAAIKNATELITGNLGGYVINGHDTNDDGYPDENLIMDTNDITTATKVIRSNLGGIGFSTNGYSGPYQTAIGFDGIVADAITTGILNANLIKAGIISDVNGNSSIDMTSGVAILKDMQAKESFDLIDENGVRRGFFKYESILGEPHLAVIDASSNILAELWGHQYGGGVGVNDTAGNIRGRMSVDSSGSGFVTLSDNNGNETMTLDGQHGRIKAPNTFDKVFDGDLSLVNTDWWTFDTNFAALLVCGVPEIGTAWVTLMIPVEMITATPTRFQLADDSDYISFNVFLDSGLIKLQIVGKSSSGHVYKVYGLF